MMDLIKYSNLLVSFLLEMVLLVMLGYWGFQQSESILVKIILAIAMPGVTAVLWGIFAAPKSANRLKNPLRTIFKLSLFATGVIIYFTSGYILIGVVFGSIVFLNVVLARIFLQDY